MKEENISNVLSSVADTVLNQPVSLSVDVIPQNKLHAWLQKKGVLPKQKLFTINQITLGNLIRISKLLIAIDDKVFDIKNLLGSNYMAMAKHGRDLATIIAIALHNRKEMPPGSLINFVETNFSSQELMSTLNIVLKQMDVSNFMKSIISIKGLNILENQTASVTPVKEVEVSP